MAYATVDSLAYSNQSVTEVLACVCICVWHQKLIHSVASELCNCAYFNSKVWFHTIYGLYIQIYMYICVVTLAGNKH